VIKKKTLQKAIEALGEFIKNYAFSNFALMATTTVLKLIRMAPIAGLRIIPTVIIIHQIPHL